MKHVYISEDNHILDKNTSQKIADQLQPEIARVKDAIGTQYTTRYACINAPSDVRIVEEVKQLARKMEEIPHCSTVILIGIGGSSLGTRAVLQAILGTEFHNRGRKKFYCAESVDSEEIHALKMILLDTLNRGENIILIIASKSGGTIETISNAAIFINLLKDHDPQHYNRSIVVITDHGSELWYIAHAHHWSVLEIPALIGGRYSVFTAVGLFPLALMGIDIDKIDEGAHTMRELCVNEDPEINIAACSAISLYAHYQQNKKIHDTFLFSQKLFGVGQWYRQLLAESLGKTDNNGVPVGITPTVSIGSTDLHSMVQLYLGGPDDRFTTFVWVDKSRQNVEIPPGPFTEKTSSEFLARKNLHEVMSAIFDGTAQAYKDALRPFIILNLHEINEFTIGALLQMKMLEIIYLGYLLNVNPFDQPNVEKYKVITRELLSA